MLNGPGLVDQQLPMVTKKRGSDTMFTYSGVVLLAEGEEVENINSTCFSEKRFDNGFFSR